MLLLLLLVVMQMVWLLSLSSFKLLVSRLSLKLSLVTLRWFMLMCLLAAHASELLPLILLLPLHILVHELLADGQARVAEGRRQASNALLGLEVALGGNERSPIVRVCGPHGQRQQPRCGDP